MIANKSINTPAIGQNDPLKTERGITLIMVLIFMVTLSLVAAVGMRGVITGERVGANERDKAMAFQAAESAGREGVAKIVEAYTAGGSFPATTIGAANGTGHPLGGNAQFWRTTSDLTESSDCVPSNDSTKRFKWGTCSEEASADYSNTDKPRYVIEKLPGAPGATAAESICWYRITSHATGKSKEADVILQIMFSQGITGLPSTCK